MVGKDCFPEIQLHSYFEMKLMFLKGLITGNGKGTPQGKAITLTAVTRSQPSCKMNVRPGKTESRSFLLKWNAI